MTTKHEPQVGDVTPFIEALGAVKAERDALLAALREVKRLRDLWRSQDDDAIDSIDYMDGLDRIDVDSVLARATGGAR